MSTDYKIYLDVCCLNRPLDDFLQDRIRLEAEAVLLIYRKCRLGEWSLINSEAIEIEISRNQDVERRVQLQLALKVCDTKIILNNEIEQRTKRAIRLNETLTVLVGNPASWFIDVNQKGEDS